jgi:phage/plasmid-like protein (TIGR03299 family)
MGHHWDSGFMVREPSWHKLENAVLPNSPQTWEEARTQAGLTWDIETSTVYTERPGQDLNDQWADPPVVIDGYHAIRRDDTHDVLAVRPTSYHTIKNADFGDVIDTVLGRQQGEPLVFESLMSLYGGRQIVALCYFEEPLKMGFDPSETFRYLGLVSRHDGQGGLRGLPTNVRIQCANTLNLAEALDLRSYGFTIRHTANWEQRLEEVSRGIEAAKGESERWLKFAEELASWKVSKRTRNSYIKRFLPTSDDDGPRKRDNVMAARTKMELILEGDSCAGINDSGYGLLMASTEWSDHYRQHASADSLIARQILRKEEPKARAARILRTMAGIKG